jgi:hypothetical protein
MNEQDFGELFDEKEISAARKKAEETYRDVSSSTIDSIRRKCKNDLYFLGTVLGYDRLTPRLHGDYTKWLSKWRGYQYKLSLLPRGHYKSTCDTILDSVQMALPNTADIQEHPYHLGPNLRMLLAHEVREKASGFLFEITKIFTRSPIMLALFSECIPSKNEQRINKWELELPREIHQKEPTFSTVGVGGAAQGGHYDWLKLDDLIGEEARDSDTVMKRILAWFDNILALASNAEDGFNLTGTRWAYYDVYSHAMQIYGIDTEGSVLNCIPDGEVDKYKGGLLKVYARGVFEDGAPIFPELMTPNRVKILRQNRLIWAAQYANNPLESGLNEFHWPLKFYNVDLANPRKLVVFTGESSFSRRLEDLDICIFVDPSMAEKNTADEVGIIVTGVDHRGNIFILETVKERIDPTKFMDQLYKLNFKYRPRVVAIEEVVFSAIFRYWIEDRGRLTGIYLPIRPFKPGTRRSKIARIRGLTHFFSAGQVYMHEGMHDLRDEYEQFPMGKSEHLLDALAQGPEFWTRGNSVQEIEEIQKQESRMMAERDMVTGY